ncbi:putative Methionine aminopeptidase 2 [Monocercomonoides exilis]|uniref:putative Methionine aminopeptidase 2 n=1 Tax=Monocercomonoides exilis TaxID=2049356 RepID=UPI003559611B|nr:putative Methionine aminopeptidase 2 [Monocercomonoides exilis]|eukprot:MONOS_6674.1-p1 / transcript=MONOS_6674.1 / gene=MONOS_6674 / organism=Monocercomonoides_exilis_PA203 / gene_product=Methionine aminopeptidase 2 / transcript_product=Methionine aminopeptidase 2 / location=Mono_scaffold00214:67746-69779(-) / protein_length=570 / sequence_SO=supercontig / SO=protein_coding / is_pseudo=false
MSKEIKAESHDSTNESTKEEQGSSTDKKIEEIDKKEDKDQKTESGSKSTTENKTDSHKQGTQGSAELSRKPGTDLPDLQYAQKTGQKLMQTLPPTVPISEMFPKKKYPSGKIDKYADEGTLHRSADSAKIRIEIMNDSMTNDFRKAAEVHRQMRAYARSLLHVGMKLYDFVTEVEMRGRLLMEDSFLAPVREDLLRASCASLSPEMQDLLSHLGFVSTASSSAAPQPDEKKSKKKGKDKSKQKEASDEEELQSLISSLYPDYTHAVSGLAFPTGLSIDNCAAHYTPNPGDPRKYKEGELMKIDIGTHSHGFIIDSAFSVCLEAPRSSSSDAPSSSAMPSDSLSAHSSSSPASMTGKQQVIQASREATWTGLKMAGIDARLCEIGGAIEETIRSFEAEIGGRTRRLRPVKNLSGHELGPYLVHDGNSVPIVANGCEPHLKMEEGHVYAIETFASTGKGSVSDGGDCSHYMMDPDALANLGSVRNPKGRKLAHHISQRFSTLAWCRRWLDETGEKHHLLALKSLIDAGLVDPYPPLSDTVGSFVSQHEHTILLRPTAKEVVSFGDDDNLLS